MKYPYRCDCKKEFTVYKSSKDIDRVEICPNCGHNCTKDHRYLGRGSFYGADDWNKAEFNPAFGKVIRNKKHRDQEAKAAGMIEVGNEDMGKYGKKLDADNEAKRQARWDKV
jgi:hypothetical protein